MKPLLPRIASSKELQGGFKLGGIQVPPHPSVNRGSRVPQGVLYCKHKGSQRLLLRAGGVRDRARVRDSGPPFPPARRSPPPPSLRQPRSYGATREKLAVEITERWFRPWPPPPPQRSSPGKESPRPSYSARIPQRASPSGSGVSRLKGMSGGHRHSALSEPQRILSKNR